MIVSNTSPLIAFSKIDRFDILQTLFKKITIPVAVHEEFLTNCTDTEHERFNIACKIFIEKVQVNIIHQFSRHLGQGEREALSLYIQQGAQLLLMDDKKGYNEAKEHAIQVASTRAILKIAEEKNIIENYQALEQLLKEKSFFVPKY